MLPEAANKEANEVSCGRNQELFKAASLFDVATNNEILSIHLRRIATFSARFLGICYENRYTCLSDVNEHCLSVGF